MNAIRLQRFKGFIDSGWIELKPITLLFGYNSAGKSTILQALLMLKQSLENPFSEIPFDFSSPTGVDLGSYGDVIFNHEINNAQPITIALKVNFNKIVLDDPAKAMIEANEKKYEIDLSEIEYSMKVSFVGVRRSTTISEFTIKERRGKILLKMMRPTNVATYSSECFDDVFEKTRDSSNMLKYTYNEQINYHFDYLLRRKLKNVFSWKNFLPTIEQSYQNTFLVFVVNLLTNSVQEYLEKLVNVGPLRTAPVRTQFINWVSPNHVGTAGEYAFQLYIAEQFIKKSSNLSNKVNKWLANYNIKLVIRLVSNVAHFMVYNTKSKIRVNIKDVGFGLSQILPIVIQSFHMGPASTLLVEQPEIHLHPRAQADLADMFISAIHSEGANSSIVDQRKSMIIETHSEHLLLRLQRRIAETYFDENTNADYRISNDDVAVYYISNNEGESIAHKIEINRSGMFDTKLKEFSEFFSDDYNEILQTVMLRAKNKTSHTDGSEN